MQTNKSMINQTRKLATTSGLTIDETVNKTCDQFTEHHGIQDSSTVQLKQQIAITYKIQSFTFVVASFFSDCKSNEIN